MPAPLGTMTFVDLQNEVLTYRFKEQQRTSVKRWINQRYGWVWAGAAWPFKYSSPTALTVTAGTAAAAFATATDVLRPLAVWDQNGDQIEYLVPREFQLYYQSSTSSGDPQNYTVIGGTIYLGPTPQSSQTFQVGYERKVGHFNGADAKVVGLLDQDTDYPIWDPAYHYMLVMGATATGLKLVNDPTWEALEDEFRAMVIVMEQELLPADRGENIQFGSRGWIFAES